MLKETEINASRNPIKENSCTYHYSFAMLGIITFMIILVIVNLNLKATEFKTLARLHLHLTTTMTIFIQTIVCRIAGLKIRL